MISGEIQTVLNNQLNEEQTASQEYLGMSAWFESQNLKGFAAFMRRQSDEERMHALKFFDQIFDRGGEVSLREIKAPNMAFGSPIDVFKAALERERANSRSINECYRVAVESKDYATQAFLQWFLTEQVEEEQWGEEAVGLLETAGNDRSALLMLDDRYGKLQTE
ncbi:MAG: ferritin [Phycisphaerales bacterium]